MVEFRAEELVSSPRSACRDNGEVTEKISMRLLLWRLSICALMMLLGAVLSAADDLESAKRAYKQSDYATALKELTPLAKQGNPEAQILLGRMYLRGYGVLKDPDEAWNLFQAAAAEGNPDGEFFIGARSVMHHVDVPNGLKYLRLSAEQGNQDAQLLLGKTYLEGIGSDLPRDPVQADMWLRLAANHNLPFYQNELRVAEQRIDAADIAKGKALAQVWKPKRGSPVGDTSKPNEKPKS
jgi:uncharacterized protein